MSKTYVIIGGGAIGLSTAYQLARKSVGRVILLEKGLLGDGASARAAGIGSHVMWTETGLRARKLGFQLFQQFSEEWSDYTFHNEHGCLNLFDPAGWLARQQLLPLYDRLQVVYEILSAEEIRYRWPAFEPPEDYIGLLDPRGGYSEPDEYIAALAKRVRQLGVEIHEHEPLVEFLRRGDHVTGVRTARLTIEADAVVSTVHVWSLPLWKELSPTQAKRRQLANVGTTGLDGIAEFHGDGSLDELSKPAATLRMVTPHSHLSSVSNGNAADGLRLPMKHFVHQRYVTKPLSKPFEAPPLNADPYLGYLRPAAGNRLLMGVETAHREEYRVQTRDFHMDELSVSATIRDHARQRFKSLAPVLNGIEWESERIGLISFTSDGEPILGPVRQFPGLYVAASFHSGGFSYNTVAGLLLAEMIADGRTSIDVSAFSPDRFALEDTESYLATTVQQCQAVKRRH